MIVEMSISPGLPDRRFEGVKDYLKERLVKGARDGLKDRRTGKKSHT